MENGDDYSEVWCVIGGATPNAVRVRVEGAGTVWVPRSVLFGPQNSDIDKHLGDNIQLKIRSWFAKREGLI